MCICLLKDQNIMKFITVLERFIFNISESNTLTNKSIQTPTLSRSISNTQNLPPASAQTFNR